jgi:hypothetical protein
VKARREGGAEPLRDAYVAGRTPGDAFEAGEAARMAEGVGEVTDCDTQGHRTTWSKRSAISINKHLSTATATN